MLKSSTTLKQSQDLKLSPQQIQFMKLLQVPIAQLEQRIKEEVEINPLLEEGPEIEEETRDSGEDDIDDFLEAEREGGDGLDDDYVKDYINDDPTTYKEQSPRSGGGVEDFQIPITSSFSFIDFLKQQRRMLELDNENEELIADQIIGSLDPDGYLRRDTQAICYDLLAHDNVEVSEDDVEKVLSLIQQFDPPGVAARNLRECLLIQLNKRVEQADDEHLPVLQTAIALVRDHFEDFSNKKFEKVQHQLDISPEQLRKVNECILHLSPKPTSGLATGGQSGATTIIPDFFVTTTRDGELQLSMNSMAAPQLHISDHYKELLKKYRQSRKAGKSLNSSDKQTLVYLKENMDSASWFIDAIRQRQDTLQRTMHAIMMYQKDYFLTGDERKIQPMILKNIADITDLDISTISRVVNSKWVQTEFGVKLLKELFSESLQTDQGEEVSTLQVKNVLSEIIDKEDKQNPYSDNKLTELLVEQGYRIARRTVAKYREQLNLPVARLRKEL